MYIVTPLPRGLINIFIISHVYFFFFSTTFTFFYLGEFRQLLVSFDRWLGWDFGLKQKLFSAYEEGSSLVYRLRGAVFSAQSLLLVPLQFLGQTDD